MTALRTAFIFLLLVNLAFFAWAQGYFGNSDNGREPDRLAQQLAPEKLKVWQGVKPTASPTVEVCRIIDGLAPEVALQLRTELESKVPGLKVASEPVEESPGFWLIVPAADKAAADKKLAELKRLGISGVMQEEGKYKFAIVLGVFNNEFEGKKFLDSVTRRGVRSAVFEPREKIVVKMRLVARGTAAGLEEKLQGIVAPFAGATLSRCS